jgi:hypothetical protein
MGSSRQSKSVRVKSARSGERSSTSETVSNQASAKVVEIPPAVLDEIENQRGALVTVITLLHCLHVVLQQREDSADDELNPRMEAVVRWSSLPEMTAMLLERTHVVLSALDSMKLTKALKAFEP